ncbi:MAG TPA: type VI secretion protein IcmF/TssM N-terminal domain-containing protein [Sedimentisphaerales bacterium]|nr:type VI secretion protein IcmF/TssM N-terminal domain-containing protein [Sedimentisphaerales bacterium]
MVSGISAFTNLPTPVKVGLLVVSGGSIMGAIAYALPPQLLWIVFVGLGVVALLLLVYWRLLKWYKKRKAAPMERGVIENTSSAPVGISDAAHMARLDDLRKKFEDGIAKFHAAGKSLYNFPWYMIVGEPGSGKTEAIRHCNVGFPPGLQDQFQGAGGTLNMNWWFTDHAVVLDTAGRLMFEEVESGGSREWREFLQLLKTYRPRCPVNGVFLVIPADSLIRDTADEIEKKASKIARQFDVIQRTLDVRFPVFVIVTKSDLVNGFRDFFDNLTDPQLQHQILGWSNPTPLDEPYNPDFVNQHLQAIRARLFRRRLGLLQETLLEANEPGAQKIRTPDTLYAFPQSLTKIAPRMGRYLELIFSVGSQWSCKPLFFRGIYFTSSMREGSALDEDLAESLGVPVDSLPDGRVWERDRAYFLRDLFMKKVFREKGLVTYATNATKLHSRRKGAVLFSAAASVILLLLFTFYAASRFSRSIGNMEGYFRKSAALVDAREQNKLRNELQVIKQEGEGNYRYIGRAGIQGMAEDSKRFSFSAQLAGVVGEWEKKGVPWIFAPAAKFTRGIKAEKLSRAEAVLYETSVLQPFVQAARRMMEAQQDGSWTRQSPEASVLRQLVRLRANKPLTREDEYSDQTFLDPFFRYVFRYDKDNEEEEDFQKRMKMYDEDKAALHEPLGAIYAGAWPPSFLRAEPNSLDAAIKNGVGLFNEYWSDPGRLGAQSADYAQVETIQKLKAALEKFDAAEERILSLRDGFDYARWQESFESLSEARESIDKYARDLKSTVSLEELWTRVANSALREVNENYMLLLNELDPNKVKKEQFLGDIRDRLEAGRSEIADQLKKGEFAERLRLLNERFYARIQGGKGLYEIRFEMYSRANEQLGKKRSISGVNQVPSAVADVEGAVRDARREIGELRNLDPVAFRFLKAADVSTFALGLAERRQMRDVVDGGLGAAAKSVKDLGKLVEEEAKEDWEGVIPARIVKKEFDPVATVAMLDGWKLLGDKLKQHFPDETPLLAKYEDANSTYTRYGGEYISYWLENVADYLIESRIPHETNWKAQQEQIQKLDLLDVFAQLNKFATLIKSRALDKFENYILGGDVRVKQFREGMEKLGDRFFQRKCERVLEKWGGLSSDAFKARNTLLSSKPNILVKDYFPFSAGSSAEFADMYWTKLTEQSLRLLADQTQDEVKEAFKKLKTQYGGKFPLERDSTSDLTLAELKSVNSLLGQVQSLEQYDKEMIGGGAETGVTQVDKQLGRLREVPLPAADKDWAKGIKSVFQGLPPGEDPYYCKIILLGEGEQRRLVREGEELLLDYLTEFRLLQGTHASGRFNTRARENRRVDMITYPGPSIRVEFYQYPSDTEARTSLEFSQPWGSLRMLHQCYDDRRKGYVKLNVKDKAGVGGVFYLQLEFCRDSEGTYNIELPRPDQWPSLKK